MPLASEPLEGAARTPHPGRQIFWRAIGQFANFAERGVELPRSGVGRCENVGRFPCARSRARHERVTAFQMTDCVQVSGRCACLFSTAGVSP